MSDDYYKKLFSKNLKRYMDLNGKTQIDIVKDLGINKSAISTWCNGTRLPRMDKVDMLAKYLHCKRSDLIEEKNPETTEEYYLNPETKKIAQEIYENKELSLLFNAARTAEPEDLITVHTMLTALKRKEKGDE